MNLDLLLRPVVSGHVKTHTTKILALSYRRFTLQTVCLSRSIQHFYLGSKKAHPLTPQISCTVIKCPLCKIWIHSVLGVVFQFGKDVCAFQQWIGQIAGTWLKPCRQGPVLIDLNISPQSIQSIAQVYEHGYSGNAHTHVDSGKEITPQFCLGLFKRKSQGNSFLRDNSQLLNMLLGLQTRVQVHVLACWGLNALSPVINWRQGQRQRA